MKLKIVAEETLNIADNWFAIRNQRSGAIEALFRYQSEAVQHLTTYSVPDNFHIVEVRTV